MPETSKSQHDHFKLFAAFLTVGIISLVQPGCNCSSSNGATATPSAVTAVLPLPNSVTALITTDVSAVFRDEMDSATVENAFTLTVNSNPVLSSVTYDAMTKTATLTPVSDLLSDIQYRATIDTSVKDINGSSPLSSDFVWSFKTSPAMLLTSKNTSGVTANDISKSADIDATGRYIVFESEATNLTSIATTFNRSHIYRKDTVTGIILLVSSDARGLVEANDNSSNPGISTNGRYIVFESTATNLDINITSPGTSQIYLKDLVGGSVELISSLALVPDDGPGAKNASVSDDGLFVVFESEATNLDSTIPSGGIPQIYLKDMIIGSIEMISRSTANTAGNGASTNPDMSADGRHIVFESIATNFIATNGFKHIYYVNNSVIHAVEKISVATGAGGLDANADSNKPSVSDDGSKIAFHTKATNLDGPDVNGFTDVYYRNRVLSITKLVSANPNTSASGNGSSSNAQISGNANYVVFESLASDLIATDILGVKDIFVRDLSALSGIDIKRVNNPYSGNEATSPTEQPVISTDGRYVSFHSIEKYTIDDTDTLSDVFRAHNSTHP